VGVKPLDMNKPIIICLMGPTAAGKTALAIELTQILPCEIISVDSGMIYRGMDIGTAKPTLEEQRIAPHRLIDICDPSVSYSAGQFRRDALAAIEEIIANGNTPLLVGGTMLYFKVLQEGIAELPAANAEVRALLTDQANKHGWEYLHQKLQQLDPITAAKISSSDRQRIQRALELYEITKIIPSELYRQKQTAQLQFDCLNLGIAPAERETLHKRIVLRFQKMLQSGFIEEVERLYARDDLHPDLPAIRTVGYRQAWDYLEKKISWEGFCELVPIATRQLAKRQMTWLRSWKQLNWLITESHDLTQETVKCIKEHLNW
jgi:tRNA dimethylallyltransferase